MKCPNCSADMRISMKKSLEPYTMTMVITPDEGRMVAAKTVGGTLNALVGLLRAEGREMGHETAVHVHELSVSESGEVRITVNALPVEKEG